MTLKMPVGNSNFNYFSESLTSIFTQILRLKLLIKVVSSSYN